MERYNDDQLQFPSAPINQDYEPVSANNDAQSLTDQDLATYGDIRRVNQRDALSNISNTEERLLPESNSVYRQARLANGIRRPKRVLISLIDKLPTAVIEQISPTTVKFKKSLKWPLIFYCLSCGILNGVTMVVIKSAGEIWVTNVETNQWANIVLALFLMAIGAVSSIVTIYALNKAFCHYNNLDVLPIYQSFILLMMNATGLLVLDEQAFYTWVQILGLMGSASIVITGIWVLTLKHNHIIVQGNHPSDVVGDEF